MQREAAWKQHIILSAKSTALLALRGRAADNAPLEHLCDIAYSFMTASFLCSLSHCSCDSAAACHGIKAAPPRCGRTWLAARRPHRTAAATLAAHASLLHSARSHLLCAAARLARRGCVKRVSAPA